MKSRALYQREIRRIHEYIHDAKGLNDRELAAKTEEFKERLSNGESLDSLMEEAYAVVCVADERILGMMPYDVQIMGAIALHRGRLAEMNTGEGKTLTATLPLYLNALTGKSTMLVTANEYLAIRDAEEMGPVYSFLGMTVRAGVKENVEEEMTNAEKRECYGADILYTTHGALGFDYLFENLVSSAEERFMREFYYVIIDEADSVLLDGAQMPLVISGAPRVQSNLYEVTDFFVTTLKEDEDYDVEENLSWLNDQGVDFAKSFFGVENFFSRENFELNRHVTLALTAHTHYKKQKDYMINEDGEVILLDNGTGRSLPGMKLRGGQHQAIEQKEGLKISQDQRSVASVTYQNLFRMFPKMAGMSGTIYDAKKELRTVYNKKVVRIPTNRPRIREDLKDLFFQTAEDQYLAVVEDVKTRHDAGQPILIITSTIADTRIISMMLLEMKIPHSVLNANNAFWEADIIREAGKVGAVTVSTGIAGRGTDIKLKPEAKELGGLAVIGIGRMENTRLEGQARGRSGRQGDPGISQFYVCLEDEIVKTLGEKYVNRLIGSKRRFGQRKLKKIINGAQKKKEDSSIAGREMSIKYDKILKRQRDILYDARNRLLDHGDIKEETLEQIIQWNINHFVKSLKRPTKAELNRYVLDNLSYQLQFQWNPKTEWSRKKLRAYLMKYARMTYQNKMESFDTMEEWQEYVRLCTLHALDELWIEEVDYLQQLTYVTSGRSTAMRNPLFEYSEEAYKSFQDMKDEMRHRIMRNIFLGQAEKTDEGKISIVFP
ncbi:MAG: accessory Sec system translocase SecA2 [Lachnospiraceae bacterium]|nr:accessory Sec system translocase SecA2 [Lachnospiraceae bacterium]